MRVFIGLDDTDNLNSRGTGYLVRMLSEFLEANQIIQPIRIVRHQLLVHEDIPYTSHNSAASIQAMLLTDVNILITECETFLVKNSASGSDVGLCIIKDTDNINSVEQWGNNAKKIVLTMERAINIAKSNNIYLKGLTGRHHGIVGALAAVGLALSGNDGRVLWMRHLRETLGIYSGYEIKEKIGIEKIINMQQELVADGAKIFLDEWTRPVILNHSSVLYVEPVNQENYEYKTAPKHFIKSVSE